MTNFLCFVIALHVVSFANLYVIKNLNLNLNFKINVSITNEAIGFEQPGLAFFITSRQKS